MYKRVSDSYLFQKSDEKMVMHALYHGELVIQRCQGLNRIYLFLKNQNRRSRNSVVNYCVIKSTIMYVKMKCSA